MCPLGAVGCDRPHRVRHGAPAEERVPREPQHRRLVLVDHVAPVGAYVPAIELLPVREATLRVLVHAVADPLRQYRALPLRQHLQHAQLEHARAALGYALARIEDLHPVARELDPQKRHLVAVAHDARHLVDHHEVEQVPVGVREHPLERRPVGVAARLGMVAVLAYHREPVLLAVRPAVLDLDLDGLVALVVA